MQDFQNSLFQSMFDGVCQVDQNARVLAWNAGAERITGFAAKQIVGTSYAHNEIWHIRENGQVMKADEMPLLLTLRDGIRRESLTFIKHADGFQVSILSHTLPATGNAGETVGAIEIFNDNKVVIAAFQQNQRVEQTILIDALTGIGNRPHIEGKIRFAIEDCKACHIPFGILFIDIDHFKQFNDTHGHLVGDKVLRFVAKTIRQNLRTSDSCGRWGGEEFVALVQNVNREGLKTVAEKIRLLIEQSVVEENERNLKVTISIGATAFRLEDSLQGLLERADGLLYQSKQGGRNRVTTDE